MPRIRTIMSPHSPLLPMAAALAACLLGSPPAGALDWVQFSASGGPVLVGVAAGSYGVADGHDDAADLSGGLQVDVTMDFLEILSLGTRFAWLDLAPAPDSSITVLPSLFLGLKSPSMGFLPEAYARFGAAQAGGSIGDPDWYPLSPGFAFFATAGVRYVMPKALPLARWGLYTEYTEYIYIEGTIPTLSLGIARVLW